MAASGITSSGLFGYGNLLSEAQKLQSDFQQLGKDLQSGNLSAAQSDLTAFTQDAAVFSPSSGAQQSTSPIGKDFQLLTQDLQSGNLSAAQQDYTTIVQALQGNATPGTQTMAGSPVVSAGSTAGGVQGATQGQEDGANSQGAQAGWRHGHHRGRGADGGNLRSEFAQFMGQLGQALQSGNMSAAQQAYSAFSQDLSQSGPSPAGGQNGGQTTPATAAQGGANGGSGSPVSLNFSFTYMSISVTA